MAPFYKLLSRYLYSNQIYCIAVSCMKWSAFCFRMGMKILGPLMLLLANVLISIVTYTFFSRLLPRVAGESIILYAFHTVFGIFFLSNVTFNYLTCAFTSAGHPETCSDPGKYFGRVGSVVDNRIVHQVRNRLELLPGVAYRYCRECCCIKPPRSHHCSISGKCVLNMDHYCPWMSNCIGYRNYRYFVLFLLYLFIGSIYVISIIISVGPYLTSDIVSYIGSFEDEYIGFSLMMAISATLAVGFLLAMHIFLCLTNQTTIEMYINMAERQDAIQAGTIYKNPYNIGWRKNLKRVFSDVPWYQMIALSRREPPPPEYPLLPSEISDKNSNGHSAYEASNFSSAISRV